MKNLVLAIALMAAVAACGGGASEPDTAPAASDAATPATSTDDYVASVDAAVTTYKTEFASLEGRANNEPDFLAVNRTFFSGRAELLSTLGTALAAVTPPKSQQQDHAEVLEGVEGLTSAASGLANRMDRAETSDEVDQIGYDESYNDAYAEYQIRCAPLEAALIAAGASAQICDL